MQRPGWTAALALLAFGVLAGALGAHWFRAMEPHSADVADDVDGEIAAALDELRRSIDGLPAALRAEVGAEVRAVPSLASERRPADAPAESDAARLARAVERLEALLARGARPAEGARSSARFLSESWKGPGFQSLAAMRDRVVEIQRGAGEEWWEKSGEELTRAHLLWTRDDVIDRYGAPRRVVPSNGINLEYDQAPFQIGEETCWFAFITTEGLVTSIEYECP